MNEKRIKEIAEEFQTDESEIIEAFNSGLTFEDIEELLRHSEL